MYSDEAFNQGWVIQQKAFQGRVEYGRNHIVCPIIMFPFVSPERVPAGTRRPALCLMGRIPESVEALGKGNSGRKQHNICEVGKKQW